MMRSNVLTHFLRWENILGTLRPKNILGTLRPKKILGTLRPKIMEKEDDSKDSFQ